MALLHAESQAMWDIRRMLGWARAQPASWMRLASAAITAAVSLTLAVRSNARPTASARCFASMSRSYRTSR